MRQFANMTCALWRNKGKRFIAALLSLALLFAPGSFARVEAEIAGAPDVPEFTGLGDPSLLVYLEDSIYAGLEEQFSSDDYIVEDVQAVYYSKEYLENVAYNSRSNIFFGYTLAELDEQFEGKRYIFTLGETGNTTVTEFKDYDDTYERVIKNVAIGTGVILFCVAVSVITGGAATQVGLVFAASAKTGAIMGLSSGTISALSAGAVKGIETQNMDEALKAAALEGSKSFKIGAIVGVISGAVSELNAFRVTKGNSGDEVLYGNDTGNIDENLSKWRQSELRALDRYKGNEQVAFKKGVEVPYSTKGATRPDIVNIIDDHLEAVEVKNYNLENEPCLKTLCNELKRQVTSRVYNLPSNSTQRIVLDVTNRNFSNSVIDNAIDMIHDKLWNIYPDIPIDVIGNLAG